MVTFLKAQASAFASTIVDFLITIVLKEVFGTGYLLANICGNLSGGITNFFIGRTWVFYGEKEKRIRIQMFRYVLIWVSSSFLNTTSLWLLTQIGTLHFIVSKVIVSLLVGWGFNYILQKRFVFR